MDPAARPGSLIRERWVENLTRKKCTRCRASLGAGGRTGGRGWEQAGALQGVGLAASRRVRCRVGWKPAPPNRPLLAQRHSPPSHRSATPLRPAPHSRPRWPAHTLVQRLDTAPPVLLQHAARPALAAHRCSSLSSTCIRLSWILHCLLALVGLQNLFCKNKHASCKTICRNLYPCAGAALPVQPRQV